MSTPADQALAPNPHPSRISAVTPAPSRRKALSLAALGAYALLVIAELVVQPLTWGLSPLVFVQWRWDFLLMISPLALLGLGVSLRTAERPLIIAAAATIAVTLFLRLQAFYAYSIFTYIGLVLTVASLALAVLAVVPWGAAANRRPVTSTGGRTAHTTMGAGAPAAIPAGWYPDPENPLQSRYWDGSAWTDQRGPAVGAVTAGSTAASLGEVSACSRLVAAVLCFFLGGLGIHRFYVGKTGTGVVQLVTLGGLGVWALIDFILIVAGSFRDAEERLVLSWGDNI